MQLCWLLVFSTSSNDSRMPVVGDSQKCCVVYVPVTVVWVIASSKMLVTDRMKKSERCVEGARRMGLASIKLTLTIIFVIIIIIIYPHHQYQHKHYLHHRHY